MKNEFSIGTPSRMMFHQVDGSSSAEDLFSGYDELYFISFATSLRALLALFEVNNFKKVEGIIGESMTDSFRGEIKGDMELVSSIVNKIKAKTWLIYVRKKKRSVIHDKFYLLKSKSNIRVIIGSSNLTETGLYGKGQKNIVVSFDYHLPADKINNSALEKFFEYFSESKTDCELFMHNLINILDKEGDGSINKDKIIIRWLNESGDEYVEKESSRVIKGLSEQALEHITEEETSFTIKIPETKEAQRTLERVLPANHFERTSDNRIIVPTARYFKLIKENVQYPLMYIRKENDLRKIYLITDKIYARTSEPKTANEVNIALQNLEDFCNTVDLGQTDNPFRAKMVFFEAILYFLNAPFSHELMKAKKETVGIADDTGLQYLFICGPGSNSKTQLIRFMLKVLTGQLIDPLPVEQFTAKKVEYISTLGTVFPIVADDVRNEKLGAREDLFKNYWEKHWDSDNESPQIIVTTNYRDILNKEWATRRIKGLDFDVVFKKKQENSQKLNQIMAQSNNVFKYFSHLYLNETNIKSLFMIEDELNVARHVMKELYRIAERPLPKYFPEKPVEEKYDKNLEKWIRSIQLKKIYIKNKNGSVYVHFPPDMKFEVKPHLKALPQELVAEIHGDTIICERVDEFNQWLNGSKPKKIFWKRFFDRDKTS